MPGPRSGSRIGLRLQGNGRHVACRRIVRGVGVASWRGRAATRAAAIAAIALAAVLAAACGSDGPDDATRGGTLVDAEDQAPPILNVLLADGATVAGQRVMSNVMQNLLTVDDTGAYVPQLAESVPTGDDVQAGPLRVTFRLRPEARWSDGRAVTSADAVFTWRTMMAPENQVASRTGWDEIREIQPGRTASGGSCAARTCFTVVFRGDYAPWRDVFSVSGGYYLLPRHVLRGEDFNTVWNDGGVIGSGPFTLQSYQPRVRAVLARDPDYWASADADGGPFLDRIVVNFLDGPGAALAALRQGEAQMASPPPDPALIERARAIEDVEVQSVPSVFFEHLILNTEAAPLDDARVRQALAYALDRGQVTEVLLDDSVPVLQSLLRPFQLGYSPAYERYGHDPDRARDLLAQAGWTAGEDGIVEKDGRELTIPLVTTSESELRRTTARLLADQAREAGIRIVPRPESSDRIFGSMLGQGDFVAVMVAFGGGVDPSPTALLASDQIPTEGNQFSGQNVYRWSNAEADRLLARSDRQVDDAARAESLARLQELLAEEVPLIPLYQQPNTVAHVTGLEGVRVNPTQAEVFWNSAEWSLRGGAE